MSFGRYSREGVSLDVFDDRVGDGWGGITISLDCDDGDSSEVDGKLELTFFLLPQTASHKASCRKYQYPL